MSLVMLMWREAQGVTGLSSVRDQPGATAGTGLLTNKPSVLRRLDCGSLTGRNVGERPRRAVRHRSAAEAARVEPPSFARRRCRRHPRAASRNIGARRNAAFADLQQRPPRAGLRSRGVPPKKGTESMQHFSNPAHGRSDGAAALGDPLAPIIDLLDEAHRELTVPELAAVLLEVDQLAAVLDASRAPSLRPNQAMTGSDPRLTAAGRAYRSTAAVRFWGASGINVGS